VPAQPVLRALQAHKAQWDRRAPKARASRVPLARPEVPVLQACKA